VEKILIDSDVFIDFLRGHKKRILKVFDKVQNKEIIGMTTTLNVAELYSGKDVLDTTKCLVLEKMLEYFKIIPLEKETAQFAGRLRLKHRLGLADSIIAATTIMKKVKLFTFNIKHFKKIKELNFFDG